MNTFRPIVAAFFTVALVLPVSAKAPITVTENNMTTPLSRDGLIDFLNDLQDNPRDVTLTILNHPFIFDVTVVGNQAVSLNFISAELGINQTFTGADTVSTVNATETFLKSDAFLGPFYTLLNTGAGGTYSGSPQGTINSVASTAFNGVFMQDLMDVLEPQHSSVVRDITIGAGFSKFDSDGFDGSSVKVSPAYSWKLGDKKDHALNLTVPLERITIEGLRTYRAGSVIQFVKPVHLPWDLTWKIGPDLSYTVLGSEDIPSYSGTVGGGLTNNIGRKWGPYFGNTALYYGRFQGLGGIPTGLKANIFSYGVQTGRTLGTHTALSIYGIGVNEDLNKGRSKNYQTAGMAFLFRVLKRFKLEISVNRTFGIPGYHDTSASFGSAWNF